MMKVRTTHHVLAYIAAAVSAVSVILAVISRFTGQTLVFTQGSYMTFAIIAILFAIYFLFNGAVSYDKKAK